jgi:hypothetical protein
MTLLDLRSLVLATAYRHLINEPNVEAGFSHFASLTGSDATYEAFCNVVAECVRERLLADPVCLAEGALQCHWRLALTPKGVSVARELVIATTSFVAAHVSR